MSDSIREMCGKFMVAPSGTVNFSSEIAIPVDSTAECTEPRRGLKTIPKLRKPNCQIRMMRQGDISKGGGSIASVDI